MYEYFEFCKAPLCSSQARSWGYCGRHAWRHFEPGEECAWCGAALTGEDHPITRCHNQRGEAFCSSSHRSSSGRALRRFLAAEGSDE